MIDRGEGLRITSEELEGVDLENNTLRSILESLAEGVIVADQEGRFVFFNPAAERILGIGSLDIAPDTWTAAYGCYLADKVTPYPAEELPLARAMRGERVQDEVIYIRNELAPGASCSCSGHVGCDQLER